jgi:hypothetical protein
VFVPPNGTPGLRPVRHPVSCRYATEICRFSKLWASNSQNNGPLVGMELVTPSLATSHCRGGPPAAGHRASRRPPAPHPSPCLIASSAGPIRRNPPAQAIDRARQNSTRSAKRIARSTVETHRSTTGNPRRFSLLPPVSPLGTSHSTPATVLVAKLVASVRQNSSLRP